MRWKTNNETFPFLLILCVTRFNISLILNSVYDIVLSDKKSILI